VIGTRFESVLARAASGEATAFEELWRDANPGLLRYLRVLAGDHAEDVASETWLKVINGLGGFSGGEPGFRGWLSTIARHTYIDMVRRPSQRVEIPAGDVGVLEKGPTAQTPDAADLVLERLSTDAALKLIGQLPSDQAEMIMLRVVIGLSYAEVASIMGRTPGAVRVAVHRGLRRLEALLQNSLVTTERLDTLMSRHD
jgi:RNA polymerase sigma-70 factor, ECF subfamily